MNADFPCHSRVNDDDTRGEKGKAKAKYYFVLSASGPGGTTESREGYFSTAAPGSTVAATPASEEPPNATATRTPRPGTATATATATETPKPTATVRPGTVTPTSRSALTATATATATAIGTPAPTGAAIASVVASAAASPTPTATTIPTATATPRPPTATPVPPTATPTAVPEQYVRLTVTQVSIFNGSEALINRVQRDAVTVNVTLVENMGETKDATLTPRSWSQPTFNKLVNSDSTSLLLLPVHGRAVTVLVELHVPVSNTGVVSATAKGSLTMSDYQHGSSYVFMPYFPNNSGSPWSSVIQFTVSPA